MKKQIEILIAFGLLNLAPAIAAAQQPAESRELTTQTVQSHPDWPAAPVRASKGMVVSDEALASQAGVEIMKQGGNAVDAAVAVAFALAVVEPEAGNIGGGGFMLVRLKDGRSEFVDYRETAPAKSTREMYLRADGTPDPDASIVGYRSVGVPGTVAGLALALKNYGTMNLSQVMAPAIRLAADGFPVSDRFARLLRELGPVLSKFTVSRRIFLKDGGFYQAGEVFCQPELAATLRRIAQNGPAEFYSGRTAHDLADEMQREGGLVTGGDLAHYAPKIRQPLRAAYKIDGHDWEVITSPPPSSGGVATIEALNILAPVELKSWSDPSSVHWVLEAMRRVFADRAAYLADPDFARIPVRGLTSPCYADALRARIYPARASVSSLVGTGNPDLVTSGNPAPYEEGAASGPCPKVSGESDLQDSQVAEARALALAESTRSGHTTHFSVVDAAGNAVANTYTLNDSFGSGVTSSDGFLLNDEMDDFTTHPGAPNMFGLIQSEANTVEPGKRPLSSMMPTILLRDGQLSFVTGSPGGPTIISATLLSILNWMRLGMDAQAAINAPRFHHQWMPDAAVLEPDFPDAVAKDLEGRGYHLAPQRHWLGQVEAIGIDPKTGERLGAPDPRRQGAAASY